MMAPFLLPLLAASSLVASQTEAVPGDYVGVWPEEPADRRAWHDLATGMMHAFWGEIPEDAPTPRLMVSPTFVDNGHLCGSYTHELPDADYEVVAVYILRVEPGESVDLPWTTVPKITVIDRTADAAALDQACPNMPDNLRTEVLEPNLPLPPFPDFDPEAVELPQGGPGGVIMHSLDRIWPDMPEDTYILDLGYPGVRDGDHVCGEYQISTPQDRAWSPRWLLARIDAFERRHEHTNTLPMTLVNADASPDEVSAWCPRLAEVGDFETLMTPQNRIVGAKHRSSVERAIAPAILGRLTGSVLADTRISAERAGPVTVFPESAQHVCGWMRVRLTSEYSTDHTFGYIATINADRVEPDESEPFPTWDVDVTELTLATTGDDLRSACPSFNVEPPNGYANNTSGLSRIVRPADAVASHGRGEAICHFWENDPHQLHLADIQSGIARPPFYASTDELARACQTISEDEAWANTNAMRAMDGLPPLERPDTPQ
jgi:hypothetical protein